MPFEFRRLSFPDVILITPTRFRDERGFFAETFRESEFRAAGIRQQFVQENHSFSRKGVLRGLHFQRPPKAQAKLVRVVTGEIYDVAVDLRKESPTYRKWIGEILSESNGAALFVPVGFAHGFCVLSDAAHVEYKVTREFSPSHDGGVAWDDADLDIGWPIANPVVSAKDRWQPRLADIEPVFVLGEGRQ